MIQLTYRDINHSDFFSALKALDHTSLPVRDILNFNKIFDACKKEAESARVVFQKLLDKHADIETAAEGGKIVTKKRTDGNGDLVFKDQKAFDAEVEEFLNHPFSIDAEKLAGRILDKAQLTPAQYRALTAIVGDSTCQKPVPIKKRK